MTSPGVRFLATPSEESSGDEQDAALPEQHRFQIPPKAHWNSTRSQVQNVGKAIRDALREIEHVNPNAA